MGDQYIDYSESTPQEIVESERKAKEKKDFWRDLAGLTIHGVDQLAGGIPSTVARKILPGVNEAVIEVGGEGAKKVGDVLYKIIENGIAHHVSVVYGDHLKSFEILAKVMNWEIIK